MFKYIFISTGMDPLKLIENIRAHKCLYNFDCSSYKVLAWRQEAWEKVARAMGAEVSECKHNWYLLRNAFAHAVARRAKPGANAEKFDKWRYEDEMSFLLPFIKQKSRHYNDDDYNQGTNKDETQSEGRENSLLKQYIELNTKNSNTRKRKIQECKKNTQQMNTPNQITVKTSTQDNDEQEKDDIDLFFESLAKTVKKLPKLERIKLKWDIMKMVNDVEIRCLDKTIDTATSRSAQVASDTDTRRDISTVTSEPIASTSSSSYIMPGQSLLKCKIEPSDTSPSPQDRINEISNNTLVEAHTLTIMGDTTYVVNQNFTPKAAPDNSFTAINNPKSTSTPQTLPYITKVQSLSTFHEEPLKVNIKEEFD